MRITAPEFDALPWHYQRMYVELLAEEVEAEQAQSEGESPGRRRKVSALGDLSDTPFRVTQVGAAAP